MRNEILKKLTAYSNASPEKVFLTRGDYKITYAEFFKLIKVQLASLSNQTQGELRVGILLENSPEAFVCIYAVLLAGGTYVPIAPDDPVSRIEKIVADSSITQLFFLNKEQFLSKSFMLPETVEPVFYQDNLSALPCKEVAPIKSEDRACYIMYTSGSTGTPKGAVINDSQVMSFLHASQDAFSFQDREVIASLTRLNFDLSVFSLFLSFFIGAEVVFPETKMDYTYPSRLFTNHKVTSVLLVPQITNFLEDLGVLATTRFTALKNILFCGDVLTLKHVQIWRKNNEHVNLYNTYGPTETTVFVTYYKVPENEVNHFIPIGWPLKGTQITLDDDHQMIVSGDQVSSAGYLNLPSENFYTLRDRRYYKTGDIGELSTDGLLHFKGRMNDQMKINGYRIELGEVESILSAHPMVKECLCLANESRTAIYAAIRVESNSNFDLTELRALLFEFARKNLPLYAVPQKIEVVNAFELNSNGKIDKKKMLGLF